MNCRLFNTERATNALLYALSRLGGKAEAQRLYSILYFADQHHLSKYGRSITGDTYIAMQCGPAPSCIGDILKALSGDSFFSSCSEIEPFKESLGFVNRFILRGLKEPDMNELSKTDVECLDFAIDLCRDKSFDRLTELSHGMAWTNTARDCAISVKDILREAGDKEDYVVFIAGQLRLQSAFL